VCGRYTNTPTLPQLVAALGEALDVPGSPDVYERFNVAPTQDVLAVVADRHGRRPAALRWGLVPHWSKGRGDGPLRINARAESAHERPAFASLLESSRGRCLIIADGFYEWVRAEDPRRPRRPLHFALAERRPFAFAGLWTTWRPPDGGDPVRSCTILTTAANRVVAPAHDRMPVILADAGEREAWLDASLDAAGVAPLLRPLPDDALQARRASARVNAATYDAPDCLDEDDPEPEPAQLSLLG
jgi:putative SOS response-associated peptidase YedK